MLRQVTCCSPSPASFAINFEQLAIRKVILEFDLARLAALRQNTDVDFGIVGAVSRTRGKARKLSAPRWQVITVNWT